MEIQVTLTRKYLYIPVSYQDDTIPVEFFEKEKFLELNIPYHKEEGSTYTYDYMGTVPMGEYVGKTITIKGDFDECFASCIGQGDTLKTHDGIRPAIHFAPDNGWINDPNGLICVDGVYHLFYQFNPVGKKWDNISWGHAISRDLLHWSEQETALLPDREGLIYSGSAIQNKQGMLGLPKKAVILMYTSAGGRSAWSKDSVFTQKYAVSTDNGKTFQKDDRVIIPYKVNENRDPKIYWHEDSKGYYVCLFLDEHDYAIYRSEDMEHWRETEHFIIEETAWECPDLREVPIAGTQEKKWLFWTPDGIYQVGTFDGYHFQPEGPVGRAYRKTIAYAAQTFSGTADRVICIPWMRSQNEDMLYCGTMGIPREWELQKTKEGLQLAQHVVREFQEQKRSVVHIENQKSVCYEQKEEGAVELLITMQEAKTVQITMFWEEIGYDGLTGVLTVNGQDIDFGKAVADFQIIMDREIVEITGNQDTIFTAVEVRQKANAGTIAVRADAAIHTYINVIK